MKYQSISKRDILECCDEIRDDDGVSPRHQKTPLSKNEDHKQQRLCSQIKRALELVLSENGSHEVLGALYVESVSPDDKSSALLVTMSTNSSAVIEEAVILSTLRRFKSDFRLAIAHAITRKRVPSLRFSLTEGERDED